MSANKIILQLKREIWEYKFSLFWAPLIAMVIPFIFVATMLYWGPQSLVANSDNSNDTFFKSFVETPDDGGVPYFNFHKPGAFELFARVSFTVSSIFYLFIYIAVMLNFAFSCLFSDRKSNNILFWRSLPVSEVKNVIGKLLVIGFVIPAILTILYLACTGLMIFGGAVYLNDITFLGLLGKYFSVSNVVFFISVLFFCAISLLPFSAWALFMSAAVKNHPGVIGILLPVLLWVVDGFAQRFFGVSLGIQALIISYGDLINDYVTASSRTFGQLFFVDQFIKILLTSFSVAALFCGATIWLRNNRYEI